MVFCWWSAFHCGLKWDQTDNFDFVGGWFRELCHQTLRGSAFRRAAKKVNRLASKKKCILLTMFSIPKFLVCDTDAGSAAFARDLVKVIPDLRHISVRPSTVLRWTLCNTVDWLLTSDIGT